METPSLKLFDPSSGAALTTLTNDDTISLPYEIFLHDEFCVAYHADSNNVEYHSVAELCEAYGLCVQEVLEAGFPDRVLDGDTVLLLTQDAYLTIDPVSTNNPRAGERCYLAAAVDAYGEQYRVTWYPDPSFDGDDESEACDWENPSRIEKL